MTQLDHLVKMLKAVGESTRIRLLALLAAGELSVKDLTEILEQSQPRVSRHLKLLADAGVIVRHAEGAWAYFALADQGPGAELAQQVVSRLDRADAGLAEDFERLAALRAAQKEQAGSYFAEVAESWDKLRSLHVPEEAVERAIIAAVGDRPAGLMLDLGTGTGRMLELLAPHFQRGIGIDSSREMIAVARSKLADADIHTAQIRLGDIADLSDYRGQADRIIVHQVLHYFDNPGTVINAAATALKPDGEILVVDFAPHDMEFLRTEHAHRRPGLSQAQMQSWAQSAGLDVRAFTDFPNGEGSDGLTVCLWVLGPKQPN